MEIIVVFFWHFMITSREYNEVKLKLHAKYLFKVQLNSVKKFSYPKVEH
jgi:hypothetical protein